MIIDSRSAAVDNDFINHIADTKMDEDRILNLLRIILSELKLSAIIHPLVYKYEVLKENKCIARMFQENIIEIPTFEDIFCGDPGRKAYYYFLVTELYNAIQGEPCPFAGDEILSKWKRMQSLGEVHSLSMCLICGCGLFLSDDNDSKRLASYIAARALGRVAVYNRKELIDKHIEDGETSIPRGERKSLAHMSK